MRTFPDTGEPETPLLGGDVTVGVVRVGETVRRPLGANAPMIHAVLEHLEQVGFDGAPRLLGIDSRGREVLSFVEGEVAGRPAPGWIGDECRLRSVAQLLRRYNDAVATFVPPHDIVADWEIPDIDLPPLPEDGPVLLGHQDITYENVVFRDGVAAALIDFDLLKPASRAAEVLNALIYWAPLVDPHDRPSALAHVDAGRRCRIFADSYGLPDADRAAMIASALIRTRRSWLLMRHRAEHRGGGWARMWADGIGDVIARRQAWLEAEGDVITTALLA